MNQSNWKIRLMLFVRAVDVTVENKITFGTIFSANGSGETAENESRLLDKTTRLSVSGEEPAQVFGINTAILLPDMRIAVRNFINTLPQVRYYIVSNIDTDYYNEGDYIESNKDGLVWLGGFTWQDALNDLYTERGLRVIPPAILP